MAETQPSARTPSTKPKPKHKKLARLPQNAKVEKRPLLRPAILSPYAGANQQKIVYISSHTPFLSAVKRVEKLLHLADKRLVQSATTNAQQQNGRGGKRKRGADGDEILGIAEEVERLKGAKRKKGSEGLGEAGEEVVLKGTGKAIHRVLELALWFQQREGEYAVRLKTGSVGAIDDISVEEEGAEQVGRDPGEEEAEDPKAGTEDAEAGAEREDAMDVDGAEESGPMQPKPTIDDERMNGGEVGDSERKKKKKRKRGGAILTSDEVPETRVRYASVLEAHVSLR